MRTANLLLVGAMVLALTPVGASAQDRKFHVNFGGGPTFINGEMGDHFKTGWGPAIGVAIGGPKAEFQFEYAYRWFDVNDNFPVLNATSLDASHKVHQLDFNLRYTFTQQGAPVRVYGIAGPGMYHRSVEITQYVGNGVICDPYWYVCGVYPIEDVIGSRGGWDFGFNVGAGVGFAIGEEGEFYVESRYHWVQGPEINNNSAVPVTGSSGTKANGQYWPLTFGFRF